MSGSRTEGMRVMYTGKRLKEGVDRGWVVDVGGVICSDLSWAQCTGRRNFCAEPYNITYDEMARARDDPDTWVDCNVWRWRDFGKCRGCGATLGLSMLTSNLGTFAEMRIRPLRNPADRWQWLPGPLTIDGTGIYCRDCGTHITEAEELAAKSLPAGAPGA